MAKNKNPKERILIIGAVCAGIGVALGAFGAHGLRSMIAPETLAVYETGVRYHMDHAFAILIAGICAPWAGRAMVAASWSFLGGIVLFSGSLYLFAVSGIRWFAFVTPIGGILFLVGWGVFILGVLQPRENATIV